MAASEYRRRYLVPHSHLKVVAQVQWVASPLNLHYSRQARMQRNVAAMERAFLVGKEGEADVSETNPSAVGG